MQSGEIKHPCFHHFSYHSGGTRTDLALKYVEANSFTKPAGDRAGAANILIVMTDGKSNMPALTVAETKKLHNMNVKVIFFFFLLMVLFLADNVAFVVVVFSIFDILIFQAVFKYTM